MKTMKQLWELIKYKPLLYVANIVLWSIVELIPLMPVLIIREILDGFTNNSSLDNRFWWLIILTVLMYFVQITLTYAGVVVGVLYYFFVDGLLKNNLLKVIFKRPGAKALMISSGEALDCFRDDVGEVADVLGWPPDVVGKGLRAIIAVGILAKVDLQMTISVILPLLLVSSIIQQMRKKVYKYRNESRRTTSGVIGAMGEVFGAVQAIKVAGAEDNILLHFHKLNLKRHRAMLKDTLFIKVVGSILSNVVHLGTGLILLFTARSMRSGGFNLGNFALFINYWLLIANFTEHFGGMLSSYQQTNVSFQRLWDFLQDTPDSELVKHEEIHMIGKWKEEKPNDNGKVEEFESLEIRNLCYNFSDSNGGFKGVSFTAKKGSSTVITGRVASGKSTLVKVILGLLPLQEGKILWNGEVVTQPDNFFIPPRCCYTGQTPHLFSDTVRNNILLGQDKDDEENINRAIYSAVMDADIKTLENGLDTIIGPRGVKLSGGQQQRVAAARMFASKSQLYILDDLSSSLDVETEGVLWNRLSKEVNTTWIAISNRRVALEMADQIIVMKDGEMLSKGTLDELLKSCEEFRQIYGVKKQKDSIKNGVLAYS